MQANQMTQKVLYPENQAKINSKIRSKKLPWPVEGCQLRIQNRNIFNLIDPKSNELQHFSILNSNSVNQTLKSSLHYLVVRFNPQPMALVHLHSIHMMKVVNQKSLRRDPQVDHRGITLPNPIQGGRC